MLHSISVVPFHSACGGAHLTRDKFSIGFRFKSLVLSATGALMPRGFCLSCDYRWVCLAIR